MYNLRFPDGQHSDKTGFVIPQSSMFGVQQISAHPAMVGFITRLCPFLHSKQRTNMSIQFIRNKRFLYVVVHSYIVAFRHILRRTHGRSEQNRRIAIRFTDTRHHFITIHYRHIHIGHNDIRMMFFPCLQPFDTIGCRKNFISPNYFLQSALHYIKQSRIVFYY